MSSIAVRFFLHVGSHHCSIAGCCYNSLLPAIGGVLCVFRCIPWKGHLRVHSNWCLFFLGEYHACWFYCNPGSISISHLHFTFFDIFTFECQAFSVLVLYVRCTAIDPADPGILIEPDEMGTPG